MSVWCAHVGTLVTGRDLFSLKRYALCTLCGLTGPLQSTEAEAVVAFYELSAKNISRRKDMTSEYRRGVEDATKPLPNRFTAGHNWFKAEFDKEVAERRKILLTKKVTKWVAVAISSTNGQPYARGYFQDTKESARTNKTSDPSDTSTLGYYPIEIEVPID